MHDTQTLLVEQLLAEIDNEPPRHEGPGVLPPGIGELGEDAPADKDTSIEDVFLAKLKDRVVIMLLFNQAVSREQVMRHWLRWRSRSQYSEGNDPLWRQLAEDPKLDRAAIFKQAAATYAFREEPISVDQAVSFIDARKDAFSSKQWRHLQNQKLLPVAFSSEPGGRDGSFVFVTHDPSHPGMVQLLSRMGIDHYVLRFAPEEKVEQIIEGSFKRHNEYLERTQEDQGVHLEAGYEHDEPQEVEDNFLEAELARSALVNLFEAMLIEAVRENASDVHIVHDENNRIEILFRKQGELECWRVEDRFHPDAFAAVVKDNAVNVDRFEREEAQDGFMQRHVDNALIRFRVSVLPITNANFTARSESIVIRVLDDRTVPSGLAQLGMNARDVGRLEDAIQQPHGMVVLTGPTGSGKTTTLYAALQHVLTPKVNVLTVEDPVEYVLPRVRQIKLNHKLTFDQALRAILRHDPDIVMVGEIRDQITAEVAVKLANTGHLTFSTLHTNDAPSAISRLYKIGVEPFLIAYAINIIVAQRLIRTLCSRCKRPTGPLDARMAGRLGLTEDEQNSTELFEANDSGCSQCHHGYSGRRAITETLVFTDEIRELILSAGERVDEHALRKCAREEGMRTLTDSARELVLAGETAPLEMMRVVMTSRRT